MKRHRNLPFFVPFAGCTFRCAFCSQEKITGAKDPSPEEELAAFDRMMEHCGDISDSENQIAFFGGSFTNLPRPRMLRLLRRAKDWIERGYAESVRISTRPDCIDREVLAILREYHVTDVELGVQSMDDGVLLASGRGHTADDTRTSAALLREEGFRFAGQMMIGLPGATAEAEVLTAREICALGASEARIYPTVVFADTPLYVQTVSGSYMPLDDLTAAKRIAPCMEVFLEQGVRLLKIGLQSSSSLTEAPFGPRDGSIAELAAGMLYVDRIVRAVGETARGRRLTVTVSPRELSKLTGHGAAALEAIRSALSPASVTVQTDRSVPPYLPVCSVG